MSRPVRERIAELEADVEQLRLAPAAAVRARGRSRIRRRRAGTTAALAVVVAAGGFGLTSLTRDDPAPVATLPAAPSSRCSFPIDLTLPDDPAAVVIDVVGRSERTAPVTIELKHRGFAATERKSFDPDADNSGPVAVLRYGPQAVGAATVVRALVHGDVVMKFLPDRGSRTIDLVVGADFDRLATTTEVNMALVEFGEPTRPPGC
ncbi:LytR C-terminal domain-containing protein [Actinoplanes sp. CA-051413]|uniref:LytR C-terminal domain-containing protein n=1 Tax=Actinoplanes sp. CA-051413 TaxID=3239899 RepID=UPI003D96D845